MMNIKNFDLNLLLVFKELYETGSVSISAINLGLSQPAVSHALARLRQGLEDELFIRTKRVLVPTERAHELGAVVSHYLNSLEDTLFKVEQWNPKKSNRSFTLSGTSYDASILFPNLMEDLGQIASGIKIDFKGIVIEDYLSRMTRGEVDLSFGANLPEFDNFTIETLQEMDLCIIANKKLKKYKKHISLDQYLEASHILYTPTEKPGSEGDEILSRLGRKRDVCIRTSYLESIPALVIRRNYLALVPRFYAQSIKEYYPIRILEPPFEIPHFKHQMIWHRSKDNIAAHMWLRDLIRSNYRNYVS